MVQRRYRYVPPRRLERNMPGKRIPLRVEQWATLYESGFTLNRIALDTGWRPGRKGRQPVDAFSPSTIRTALRDWGVQLRKSGGRGSTKGSVLVRLAELEERVSQLEKLSGG